MTILVTGATGQVGRQVVQQLASRGADLRALVRDPAKAKLPDGVALVRGDMLDVDAIRAALKGVTTLFLLNAVSPAEFTQALVTLNLAREAGVERIVYFSVIHSDVYVDVPHFAGKHAVERMIEKTGMAATILRPAYFMNNDASIAAAILDQGVYPMPIGDKGVSMVDTRDVGEIAAIALLHRERADHPLPLETIDLVGPDALTGGAIAAIWTDVLGRPITDARTSPADYEQAVRRSGPPWMAHDMRMMAQRIQSEGMLAEPGDVERLTAMLGRPLRTYRAFAGEIATDRTKG